MALKPKKLGYNKWVVLVSLYIRIALVFLHTFLWISIWIEIQNNSTFFGHNYKIKNIIQNYVTRKYFSSDILSFELRHRLTSNMYSNLVLCKPIAHVLFRITMNGTMAMESKHQKKKISSSICLRHRRVSRFHMTRCRFCCPRWWRWGFCIDTVVSKTGALIVHLWEIIITRQVITWKI